MWQYQRSRHWVTLSLAISGVALLLCGFVFPAAATSLSEGALADGATKGEPSEPNELTSDPQPDTASRRLSEHEHELAVFQVVEKAKAEIIKWLKMGAACVVVVLSLFGLRARSAYRSALATIDAKVADRVNSAVNEYKEFTNQIIAQVVEAKTGARELQKEMTAIRRAQKSLHDELTGLHMKAREEYRAFGQSLTALQATADTTAALANEQAEFVKRSEAFAKKIGFDVAGPPILFELTKYGSGAMTQFDAERKAYLVNPQCVGKAEPIAEIAAIDSRFTLLHFERSFGGEGRADPWFWSSFRRAVVSYLVQANAQPDYKYPGLNQSEPLYRFLKKLAERTDDATATKFAVTLVRSFEPSWTYETLPEALTALNMTTNLVPEEHFAESVKVIRTTDQ